LDGFLQHSEEANGNVRRQRVGHIVASEINLRLLLGAELLAAIRALIETPVTMLV